MICNNCKKEYNGFERQCPYCGALLKTFREANPRPDDIVVVKLAGKIVSTISGVFAAVALIVLAVVVMRSISVAVESGASYGDTLAYDEQELEVAVVEAPALVAEDDMAELSRAIHNSSAGKYSELIELREVMDSLLAFANGTQPELIDLSKQLESKQKEAADAWIKAGDAQYNIAYNVQGALKYYQRADSIYNGYGRIASVVNNLKNESHLSGAALFIGGISRSGSKLKITYKYFGTSDTVIALKLEQEDTGMTTTINLTVAPATEHYRTAIVSSPFLSNYRGDVNIYEKDELLYTITPRTE